MLAQTGQALRLLLYKTYPTATFDKLRSRRQIVVIWPAPMNIWYRIWAYLLPVPMWLAEYFMRTVMHNPEVNDFFPSSLAATALGLLIPALAPTVVPQQPGLSIPQSMLLVNRKDETVRQIAMMTLFTGTLLWPATVFLSIGGQWPTGWIGERVDQKFWIGAILYLIAFGLNEWKERIKWICAS